MQKLLAITIIVLLAFATISHHINVAIPEECCRKESAISLLQQLRLNITELPKDAFGNARLADNRKNALQNKINALISQVKAGAYEGSLNKLSNDLKKTVSKWIINPWKDRLLDLIEQVIHCIKACCYPSPDVLPPVIRGVLHYPNKPNYDDRVVVLACVVDCKSGVANVTLSYSTSLGENVNLTMTKIDSFYMVEIPPKPYNTNVSYLVYAWDKAGNLAVSPTYSYVVGDFYPPIITYIERVPAEPNYNETVSLFVNATEPEFASGVKEVILSYNNGTGWTNVTMTPQEGLYTVTIPEFAFGTTVQYRVYAFDFAGNWASVDVYSYTVQDRFLPVAAIWSPTSGIYLSDDVTVEVYVYDDDFFKADLMVDKTVIASWSEVGHHTCVWNVSTLPDGVYTLKLKAYDQAGNIGEASCQVTIDNTPPIVEIYRPLDGSFVKGTVIVEVNCEDANLDVLTIMIDDFVHVWRAGGSQICIWETEEFADGVYTLVLSANDKAGNTAETSIQATVDNTAPLLSNLYWVPQEPHVGEEVNVSLSIFEDGSGIKNVTLWYRVGNGEWNSLNMTLENGNWTAGIPGQEENAIVTFYVDCYDNAGNYAATTQTIYTVKAKGEGGFFGFPLSWLLFIIVIIGLVSGGIIYYKIRKKG
ncbi:MAG: Ig-like domain repeat protein [Candidatus Bathyarchaeia archaeon]